MNDEATPRKEGAARPCDPCGPPRRLIHEARASLREADVYARALSDRFELACAIEPEQLERLPADLLVQLIAVSEAFQDGARHTLWFFGPELARSAQVIASLAREGAGTPPDVPGR